VEEVRSDLVMVQIGGANLMGSVQMIGRLGEDGGDVAPSRASIMLVNEGCPACIASSVMIERGSFTGMTSERSSRLV
jgi:hypothetical protein